MSVIKSYTEERVVFGEVMDCNPPPGVMWVAFEGKKPMAAIYVCPCGCGKDIYTPVNGSRGWQYSHGPNGPTLSPSVRWVQGCKAHFFIKDGKVEFCSDSGK